MMMMFGCSHFSRPAHLDMDSSAAGHSANEVRPCWNAGSIVTGLPHSFFQFLLPAVLFWLFIVMMIITYIFLVIIIIIYYYT